MRKKVSARADAPPKFTCRRRSSRGMLPQAAEAGARAEASDSKAVGAGGSPDTARVSASAWPAWPRPACGGAQRRAMSRNVAPPAPARVRHIGDEARSAGTGGQNGKGPGALAAGPRRTPSGNSSFGHTDAGAKARSGGRPPRPLMIVDYCFRYSDLSSSSFSRTLGRRSRLGTKSSVGRGPPPQSHRKALTPRDPPPVSITSWDAGLRKAPLAVRNNEIDKALTM